MNNIFYNFVTWVFIFFIVCLGAAIVSGLWFFLKVYLANLVRSGLRRDYIRESYVDNKDEEEERPGGRCCLMSKESCPTTVTLHHRLIPPLSHLQISILFYHQKRCLTSMLL